MSTSIAERWGEMAERQAAAPRSSMLSSKAVLRDYVWGKHWGGENWYDWFSRTYCRPPRRKVVSICCGNAHTEIHFLRRGAFREVVGIDCSPRALAVAKRAGSGLALSLRCEDVNALRLQEGQYDLAFSWMAMHHVADLEHVYEELARALRPGGLLILNEYVGGACFRCTPHQSELMEAWLRRLPEELRRDVNGRVRTQATPPPERVMECDPSEAVRADEILPQLERRFRVLDRRDYGGGLLQFLLNGSAHRFHEDNPEHMDLLATLYRAEEEAMAVGIVPNHFSFVVAEAR